MDGKKLTLEALDNLDEVEVDDLYAVQRRIYECLDLAVGIFCRETRVLHAEVDISTDVDQQEYDLPPGFIALYMKNTRGRYFLKYDDGDNLYWPPYTTYERIWKTNLTDTKDVPNYFALRDKPDKEDLIEGAADVAGAATGGECTLQDDSMLFTTTDRVYSRDIVHNNADGSTGYVLSVTDATHLKTALFGGSDNDWTIGDTYVIQPAAEKQIVLDAPSTTAGHTITVPYLCMPSPVYSDYGFWRLPPRACKAVAAGAAALFKLSKKEFTESAQIGGLFSAEIRRYRTERALQALQEGRYR